jgi:hypothetical protein
MSAGGGAGPTVGFGGAGPVSESESDSRSISSLLDVGRVGPIGAFGGKGALGP